MAASANRDEYHSANEELDDDNDINNIIRYTNTDEKYLRYKAKLLGKCLRKDKYCEFYYLEDEKIGYFCNEIKTYGVNLKIEEKHIQELFEQIITDEEPYLVNNIALVEYEDYRTSDYNCLIEVIDGHHRFIEALRKVYDFKPDFKLGIWICLHKSNNPNNIMTRLLFKKYNSLKPFIVDINISEMSSDIIQALNHKFGRGDYIPIENKKYVRRPSICESVINTFFQKQLEIIKRNELLTMNLDITKILQKFEYYNTLFSRKTIDYFNDRLNVFSGKDVSDRMVENARRNNFYLGLVDIDELVKKCFET